MAVTCEECGDDEAVEGYQYCVECLEKLDLEERGVSVAYQDDQVTVYLGDCRDVLRTLDSASVDAVVTDPPYELGFMGRSWDSSGIAYDVDMWQECMRVLKPGGHILAFGGSRTWHRLAVAIEDAGFDVRDSIAWIYGQGFPKSLDVSKAIDSHLGATREKVRVPASKVNNPKAVGSGRDGMDGGTRPFIEAAMAAGYHEMDGDQPVTPEAQQWAGWGTALKPSFEPIVVGRKPITVGSVAANVLAHGTGALNVDGCRVGVAGGTTSDGAPNRKNRVYGEGMGGAPAIPLDAGRWPTNVVLDESQAVELDKQSGNLTSGTLAAHHARAPKGAGILGAYGSAEGERGYGDSGGASRFFPVFRYEAKASTKERPTLGNGPGLGIAASKCAKCGKQNLSGSRCQCPEPEWVPSGGEVTAHPTVKPLDLMRWLVRLVTPGGGLVLDPFAGSGTTAEACIIEGMRCVTIEKDPDYLPLIVQRLTKPIQTALDFEL